MFFEIRIIERTDKSHTIKRQISTINIPEISNQYFSLETLLLAGNIKKFNEWGLKQDRILAVTDEAIYNIKGTKVKRKILVN